MGHKIIPNGPLKKYNGQVHYSVLKKVRGIQINFFQINEITN